MIKKGVSIRGIRPEMVLAFFIAGKICDKYGVECVITSATDSKHGFGSLHYVGLAIDIRSRDLSDSDKKKFAKELKDALGFEFDVVLEKTHIHIEFQPK